MTGTLDVSVNSLDFARETVCQTGLRLQQEGLVARTWGNLSVRVNGEHFVISPSGFFYEQTRPEHVPLVSITDLSWQGGEKPSSEKGLHAAVYRRYPDIGAIVHTHQSAASAVASARRSIGENIPCAVYALPTTKKLARHAVAAMKKAPVHGNGWRRILLANHGAVCAAQTMADAVAAAIDLEGEAEAYVAREYTSRLNRKQIQLSDTMVMAYEYAKLEHTKRKARAKLPCRQFSRFNAAFAPDFVREVFERRKDVNHMVLSRLPFTLAFSFADIPLKPLLDDMAQIVGTFAGCIDDLGAANTREPGSRNAVFVRDNGALCMGFNEVDSGAVQMVLEKSCRSHIASALLGGGFVIPWVERVMMRQIYKKKYSRLGSKDRQADERRL